MANFKKLTKNLLGVANKNSPQILTGLGVTGVFSTAFLTGQATLRADQLIKEEEHIIGGKLTKKETVKLVWKCYIPAVGMAVVTGACIIGSNSISTKRNAAIAGLYSLTEKAFSEYKNKVVDTIGQNKETKITDSIASDHITNNPPLGNNVIFTGKGDVLCYDPTCDRYFRSDIEKIKQAVNELNERLMTEMYISLNDFYYELGLKPTTLGDSCGFEIQKGILKITYSSQLTDNGEPCLVLSYKVFPRGNN